MTTKYKVIICLLMACIVSCKSKQNTVSKEKSSFDLNYKRTLDSLVEERVKERLELLSEHESQTRSFSFNSVPVFDSLGNRLPFHYKHFVDGNLKEEIWLEGGDVANNAESKSESKRELAVLEKHNSTAIKANATEAVQETTKKVKKDRVTKVQGFQAGFYITWVVIILVLIVLWWLARRFKLWDKPGTATKNQEV